MSWDAPRVKRLRLCLGLSRPDLARRLNCQVVDIERWESGMEAPGFHHIRTLELLERYQQSYQDSLQKAPRLETYLESAKRDQVTKEDIEH